MQVITAIEDLLVNDVGWASWQIFTTVVAPVGECTDTKFWETKKRKENDSKEEFYLVRWDVAQIVSLK